MINDEIRLFCGEAIENGYNINVTLKYLKEKYNLSDTTVLGIEKIMREVSDNYNMEYLDNELRSILS